MASLEQIGTVTTRSGGLIVIDTGYLGIWSHNAAPLLPEGSLDTEEQTSQANSFVDLRLVGSDAERAGQLLDMSWNPLFVYDQPPAHPELEQKLREVVRKHHLDARFEVISPRVPHRRRINQALEYGRGAGEIQFHGVWAAVVSGVPIGESLPVLGERMSPPDQSNWKRVLVRCNSQSISRSERAGHVGVDYARLLIADFDVLGAWRHENSLDGLADFVFWGRDAEKAALSLNAPTLSPTSEAGRFERRSKWFRMDGNGVNRGLSRLGDAAQFTRQQFPSILNRTSSSYNPLKWGNQNSSLDSSTPSAERYLHYAVPAISRL